MLGNMYEMIYKNLTAEMISVNETLTLLILQSHSFSKAVTISSYM